jgi:hypothetical protein
MINDLLFAITEGDVVQQNAWREMDVLEFFGKLEARKRYNAEIIKQQKKQEKLRK